MSTTFIGIDLAWAINTNNTGIAVLHGDAHGAELVTQSDGLHTHKQVVDFVAANAAPNSVVAIDASLVVPNMTGRRNCEQLVSRAFGQYHASCHSTNRGHRYWKTGPDLVAALASQEFVHDFDLNRSHQRRGRWLFEVYPHPAMVRLFNLTRIIKYKKGPVADRRVGLQQLQGHLLSLTEQKLGLRSTASVQVLLSQDLSALRGEALKRYEDSLDALFCAYLAWHCWRWGAERNEIFGTMQSGYIVVPSATALG